MQSFIVPPLYAAGVDIYAMMLRRGSVGFDITMPVGKLWGISRTHIVGANGLQTLTIPMAKPEKGNATPLCELRLSSHGNWQHIHWGAIYSAYGKSPFFEYLEPELRPIYENRWTWLIDFNIALHQVFVNFANLNIATTGNISDGNRLDIPSIKDIPYYQTWAVRHGFIPRLSIIDLLMNEGPLAPAILQKMGD